MIKCTTAILIWPCLLFFMFIWGWAFSHLIRSHQAWFCSHFLEQIFSSSVKCKGKRKSHHHLQFKLRLYPTAGFNIGHFFYTWSKMMQVPYPAHRCRIIWLSLSLKRPLLLDHYSHERLHILIILDHINSAAAA